MDIDDFVLKQLTLLEIEREAEIEEKSEYLQDVSVKSLEHKGILLRRLRVASHRTSLYGRCLCSFQSQWQGKMLPSHRITPGDIVGVCEGDGSQRKVTCSGVVNQANTLRVQVAFETSWDALHLADHQQYSLLKLTNDVTYKRIKRALQDLQKPESKNSRLVSVLFGKTEPTTNKITEDIEKFLNVNLNEEQRGAVNFTLKQKDVAIIHGPPGTGKTTTLVEIILQAAARKEKVLVCAPSNTAVDNLVEHLSSVKRCPRIVRLGHPSRLLPKIQEHSLDALMDRSHHAPVLEDIRKEIESYNLQSEERELRGKEQSQRRALKKELEDRERSAEAELLRSVDVVLSTLTAASAQGPLRHLPRNHFSLVVIDECSQATEAACWIVLTRAPKCVIAGDHLQLPPTIISAKAAKEGLSVSLMERLCNLLGDSCTRMLCTQYRMHKDIMDWASTQLYDAMLRAHASVQEHRLCDLVNVEENEDSSCVLLLIDTAGCGMSETEIEGEESKANTGEADLVSIHVSRLVESGLEPSQIAVITPYNLQVEFLRQRLSERYPSLEILSVDGFQGREKEAVVLTLVRSNNKREIGFLAESRRINVAVTRARRHLAVICDTETVNINSFLSSLTEHLSLRGEVRTAHQYMQELEGLEAYVLPERRITSQKQRSAGEEKKSKKEPKATKQEPVSVKTSNKIWREECQPKPKASEEELTAKFEKELQTFLNDPDSESCSFSPDLTSFERRVVHMVCEKLGLLHISKDEGDKRFIQVSKKENATETNVKAENVHQSDDSLERQEALKPKTDEDHPPSVKTKPANKPKTKKKPPKALALPQEDDLDLLLASVVRADNTCSQSGCSVSTVLISQTCIHCRKHWCLKHSLPEAHGCGDAAKVHARREMHKGTRPPRVDPIKRVHVKRALDKTLNKMAQQRKTKQDGAKS